MTHNLPVIDIEKTELKIPSKATLRKYGLERWEWIQMAEHQEGVCAICKRLPKSGRLVIDHEHVKGWKKLSPDKRKTFVRGLLCFVCNRFIVGRFGTLPKLKNAVIYLETYSLCRDLFGNNIPTGQSLPPPL